MRLLTPQEYKRGYLVGDPGGHDYQRALRATLEVWQEFGKAADEYYNHRTFTGEAFQRVNEARRLLAEAMWFEVQAKVRPEPAKISTGQPSTLATYREIAVALAGEGSQAVKFFDDKIADQGPDEEVLAPETQMMLLIVSMLGPVQAEAPIG